MENLKSKSSQHDIEVISLVNFRNYIDGYMSKEEIIKTSFLIPLESVPIAKSNTREG